MSDRLSIEEIAQLVDLAVTRGVSIAISDVVITPCHVTNDNRHVTDAKFSTDGAAELLAIRAAQTAERQRRYRERRAEHRHVTERECHVTSAKCHVTQPISPPPPLSLSPSPSPSLPPPPSPTPPSSPAHTPAPPPTHPHAPTPAQEHACAREEERGETPEARNANATPGELPLGDPLRFRTKRRDSQPKPTAAQQRRLEAERTASIGGLPPELDTPAFREAWAEWNAYRTDMAESDRKKPWTPRAAAASMRLCADAGAEAAVTEIRRAIAANWTGIHFHEPARRPSNGRPTNGHSPPAGMPDPFQPIDWNNPRPGDPHYWGKPQTANV